MEVTKVRECKELENLDFWKGKKVYLGLDLSQTDDNTAVAMVSQYNNKIYAKVWESIPLHKRDFKSKKENVDYKRLIRLKQC
ncbi:terminase TerL endonuclease subunit [Clostridium sp. Marseille-Q7071]